MIQVTVSNSTYTIEDRKAGMPPYVKLSRSNSSFPSEQPAEFFVPKRLIVEYVLTQLGSKLLQRLLDISLKEQS